MQTLWQDLRYGFRMLIKNPGFMAVAVIALALGIGANTAIFSVVNAVLLRPLPYRQPEQLVMVWEDYRGRGGPEREWLSPADLQDWREQNQIFEHIAAMNNWGPTLTGQAEPEMLVGAAVSHNMFAALGIEPSLGRSFRPEEDKAGAERVVVLSHSLWQRRFGSDTGIVGKALTLSGDSYTVVGVMPASFKFPVIANVELWRTLQPGLNPNCQRGCVTLRAIARLKPEVTLERARTEMNAIARRIEEQFPDTNKGVGATLIPLHEQLVGNIRQAMLVLLGAVAFVLLIACANVANLMLARSAAREKEMAVRAALGAGRGRIVRQLLTESLLLALVGGTLGLVLAYWMVDLLVRFSPQGAPRVDEIAIDGRVLGFTLGIALLTGVVFGLAPALQVSRTDLNHSLKEGGRDAQSGARGGRLRGALVVAEMALALMLLVGAGLMIKSFVMLQRVDAGFNPDHVLTLNIALPRINYPDRPQIVAFYTQLLDRIKALPGVQSAGLTSSLPLTGNNTDVNFLVEGRPQPPSNQQPAAWYSQVSPDYFRAMGMRLVKGRVFTEQDNEQAPRVVIISETLARRYFPGEDPLGKRIGSPNNWREIVGVMTDVKHFGLETDARPSMFLADRQSPARFMAVVVRTAGEPLQIASAVRGAVWAGDKNLAVANVTPMTQLVSASIAQPRFILLLLGVFAGVALTLAAVGIYGVMSYSVTQRTREIGVRMALGARPRDVMRLVVGQGLLLTAAGVGIGLGGAVALTRLMNTLLFGVKPTDPVTFAVITLLLTSVALLACYLPARRAMKVDPMIALRYE